MKNETIIELIHKANTGAIALESHNEQADFSREYQTFFIRDTYNMFVGAVQLCTDGDIHAVTLPEYSRLGVMRRTFRNTILPYMFDVLGFDALRVSVFSDEGQALAESLGFQRELTGDMILYNEALPNHHRARHHAGFNPCTQPI